MAEDLELDWPATLIGRSSGWHPSISPEATMLHPPVTPRRPVSLAPRWRALRLQVDAEGRPDASPPTATRLLVKVSPAAGLLPGLSSGASSALIRDADGSVVRIKRCGFATKGVGGRNGHVGRIGLMGLAEALQESRMLATFRRQGLCPACEPIAIEILADKTAPFFEDGAYGAVRIRVASDTRADEWFLKLLRDTLHKAGLAEPTLQIQAGERISLTQLAEASRAISQSDLDARTFDLGRGLGGLLRAVHDAGLLRGRGSVWMGNDIVGPGGRLSAIDCDGGALADAHASSTMKGIEAAEYAAGFADCYSWGQPDWLAKLATLLADGFWDGYRAAAKPEIQI